MRSASPRNLSKFVIPEFVFGIGSRFLAGRYARNLGGRKVLVVTDPGVIAAGWADDVIRSIRGAELSYALFTSVSSNPRAEEVAAGAEVFRAGECNVLVAVGGGSSMDLAKGVGIVTTHRRPVLEFEGVDAVTVPGPPLICVPTTGGSSADVSQFAIITDLSERRKIAIVSKAVVPDVALIDPQTLITMDSYLSACTGMDALTHGIEAFVSNAASSMTDVHALEGVRLVARNLLPSIEQPRDLQLRAEVMLGSLHTGLAFSNAILGATHAMAHSLGGQFDLSHGECNAVLLDRVVEFNFPAASERYERIAEAMGLDLQGLPSSEKVARLGARLRRLREESGLTRSLSGMGIGPGDIPVLSRKAMGDPCLLTNPRPVSQGDLEALYGEAL